MLIEKIEKIKNETKNIDGWLTAKEGEFLFETAKKCSTRGVIVEIGSFKGKSTVWLALGSKEGKKTMVHAIDPFGENESVIKVNFNEFMENIKNADVNDIVNPIVSTSADVVKNWNKAVEFIFIDGNHDYEFVKQDFLLWYPHLVDGGTIAFHDTTSSIKNLLFGFPGPRKVVNKFVFKSNYFKNVGRIDTIIYGEKSQELTKEDLKRIAHVKLCKYIPDFLHFLFWNLKKIPIPRRIKLFVKRLQN
jgi:MMP 1-O-methyltransferase